MHCLPLLINLHFKAAVCGVLDPDEHAGNLTLPSEGDSHLADIERIVGELASSETIGFSVSVFLIDIENFNYKLVPPLLF